MRLAEGKPYAVAAILIWFAVAVCPSWLPTPDSALYLMLGRSLARGDGYTLCGLPHAYVPPGYPLFIAGMTHVGLGSMFWLNVSMGLVGLLSVWMSYLLITQLAPRPVSVMIACLMGLNSLLHVMSTLQLSDMPFTLFVLTGLFCLLRGLRDRNGYLELGTLLILASSWVRVAGLALAVACALGLFLQRRAVSRRRIAGNVAALLVGAAGTLAIFYGQYDRSVTAQHSLPPASYFAGLQALVSQPALSNWARAVKNIYESVADIPRFVIGLEGPPLIGFLIFGVPALVGVWRRLARREFLVAAAVGGYTAGIVVNLPAGTRYLLPVAPILFLYYLEGLSILLDWRPSIRRYAPQTIVALVAAFVALNGIKGAYAIYKNYHYFAAQRAEYTAAARLLHDAARPGERFVSGDAEWQIAYLSEIPYLQLDRCAVLKTIPQDRYLRFMYEQGVRLVLCVPDKDASLPDGAFFHSAVRDRRLFEPIAESGRFRLYRFLTSPDLAVTDAHQILRHSAVP